MKILIELDHWCLMATYQSVLAPILDFIYLSEVATIWQIDSTVHKLKPRLFHNLILPSKEFIHSVHH